MNPEQPTTKPAAVSVDKDGEQLPTTPEPTSNVPNGVNVGLGFHLVSEFVSCIVVGIAIGLAIDTYAGTKPFGLVGMALLGFVSGVYTMAKTAKRYEAEAQAPKQ